MNTPDLIEDGGRPKLLSGRTLKLQIAAVSVLILTIGAWLTPRAAPAASQRTLSAPQEHAAPLLEEQVQQREAGRAFQGVQGAAAGLSAYGVAILGETSSAAMSVRNDFEERGRALGRHRSLCARRAVQQPPLQADRCALRGRFAGGCAWMSSTAGS